MALPTTNITTTMVRNAIGAATNNVGELVTSPLVNNVGFNSPDNIQNNLFWGKTRAKRQAMSAYPLGAFRGYDHDWVAFRLIESLGSPSADIDTQVNISVPIGFAFPNLENKPSVSVSHSFTVEWSRTNNFGQVAGDIIFNGNASNTIDFDFLASNPPDGGAALSEGGTFYVKVNHLSSPARRWWIEGLNPLAAASGGDSYIIEGVVPHIPIETYNALVESFAASAYSEIRNANASITIRLQRLLDGVVQPASGKTASLTLQMSARDDLNNTATSTTQNKVISEAGATTYSFSVNYPKNYSTQPGGNLLVGIVDTFANQDGIYVNEAINITIQAGTPPPF